jgi:hypothetical protein
MERKDELCLERRLGGQGRSREAEKKQTSANQAAGQQAQSRGAHAVIILD